MGPDALDIEVMGILLAAGATKVAEAGTALLAELKLIIEFVLELVRELVLEVVLALVIKVVLELVVKVVAVVGVGILSVHVSLVGEIAVVAPGAMVEDIPIGVGSTVVMIVVSASDTLGTSNSAIHVNSRWKGK
jgi:hypothetical protein